MPMKTTMMDESNQVERNELVNALAIFRKYNLKNCEEIFKKEIQLRANSTLAEAISINDKASYFDCYDSFQKFLNTTKHLKYEINQFSYPIFMHSLIQLIKKNELETAHQFYDKYIATLADSSNLADLAKLRLITSHDQLARSDLIDSLSSNKFNVRISDESLSLLKEFLKNKSYKTLNELFETNIVIEAYSGPLRPLRAQLLYSGSVLGESSSSSNQSSIYYGILKEPDLNLPEESEDMNDESDKPKRRKNRRDTLLSKKNRVDPHAPPANRVPLPELRDVDRAAKQQALKDYVKRARLGPEKLPSICFYTILNSYNTVNCCDISDDSIWIVLGLADSTVRVCTLSEKAKLKLLKPLQDLEMLDKESDDVINMMFDETSGVDHRTLIGHSGPVYSVSFSPDKNYILSGSDDGTIRLWCLLTFSCLVSYKGHNGPVWDVQFGPYGHYFASCGHDKTARVWTTDNHNSIRIYYEHLLEVECVCFHPNCNYLATGSSDRSIRIFDLASLSENPQVRHFTGHKGVVNIMKFSTCGRYLASGSDDGALLIWDLASSILVANFASHTDSIYSLDFSRDNCVLASGGLDNTIKVWNMAKLAKEVEQTDTTDLKSSFTARTDEQFEIGSWRTKMTPIIKLHFTRRNLLVGIGPFKHK